MKASESELDFKNRGVGVGSFKNRGVGVGSFKNRGV
jgi:hypothetical protein